MFTFWGGGLRVSSLVFLSMGAEELTTLTSGALLTGAVMIIEVGAIRVLWPCCESIKGS